MHDTVTEVLVGQELEQDAGFGERLHDQQRADARRRVVDWLAMNPKMWPYVRLAMGYAQTPKDRKDEIRNWLKAAKRVRARLLEESAEYVRKRLAA